MAKNNILFIQTKQEKARDIADIMKNKGAQSILEILSEKEQTASGLAEALEMPLSTVHYHLKKLVQTKMVVADEFHYSKKGKEVLHYKLAKKYIIIAPTVSSDVKKQLSRLLLTSGVTVLGGWVALKNLSFGKGTDGMLSDSTEEIAESASVRMIADEAYAAPMAMQDVAAKSGAETAAQSTSSSWAGIVYSDIMLGFMIGVLSFALMYLIVYFILKKWEK